MNALVASKNVMATSGSPIPAYMLSCHDYLKSAQAMISIGVIAFDSDVEELYSIKKALVFAFELCKKDDMCIVKQKIREAGLAINSLLLVFKTHQKKKTRYRVTEANVKKGLEKFKQKLNEAFEACDDSINKLKNNFYSSFKEKPSNLPLKLPDSVLWKHYKADVLIYSKSKPLIRHKEIELGCYMLTANVIAVNKDKFSGTKKQADKLSREVIQTLKAGFNQEPIPRISENITFFLVLDFGCVVNKVYFVDQIDSTKIDFVNNDSSEDFAIAFRKHQEQKINDTIRKQKLMRLEFEAINENLITNIKNIESSISDLEHEYLDIVNYLKDFLAYPDDPYNGEGLPYNRFSKVEKYLIDWMHKELQNEKDFDERSLIRKDFFQKLVTVNTNFSIMDDIRNEIYDLKQKLKALINIKINNLSDFAAQKGIISPQMEKLFMQAYEEGDE